MKWRNRIAAALGCVCLIGLIAVSANAWVINFTQGWGPYPTIQMAVNVAIPGDVLVLVNPYVAENTTVNKRVTIIGNPWLFTPTVLGFTGMDTFIVLADGVRIANLRIVGTGDGIHLDADNCWIGRNIIAWNQWEGVDLWYADGNRIIDNVIHHNGSSGIDVVHAELNRILNNEIRSNSGDGINLEHADGNVIRLNRILANDENGIELFASESNRIVNNQVIANDENGIVLRRSDANLIARNLIIDNRTGVLLAHSGDNWILYNRIHNNKVGIKLRESDGNWVFGNTLYGNMTGISVDPSEGNVIEDNEIAYGRVGIYIDNSDDNDYIDNHIYENHIGIEGYEVYDSTFQGNWIEANDIGIWFYPWGGRNTISENLIEDNRTGMLFDYSDDNAISANAFVDNTTGVRLVYSWYDIFTNNWITGNNIGIVQRDDGRYNEAHYNYIAGNTEWGIRNRDTGLTCRFDAILNWWGSVDGPMVPSNPDGDGDRVSRNVIYSPWLGIGADADPGAPGWQPMSPMLIVVDDVGPSPTEGYLNAAIAGANSVLLDGHDTIEVRPGSYDVDEEITDGVSILSTEGACETTLTGQIDIGTAGVLLGEIRNGFRIDGNVRVLSGQDASLSALHWNDIYGMVENAGSGTLDATYNFWGAGGPIVQTIGSVDAYPDLPLSSCTIIGYIDEYGMTVAEVLIFGGMIAEGYSEAFARTATEIVMRCGIGNRQALGLILEYGHSRVKSALRRTRTCAEFYELLEGYAMPAGAGGAAPESVVVGEPLNVALVIVDPLTGDAVTDALVTVTVCREDVEPVEIAYFGVLPYDAETGMYGDAIDTTGWEPGTYRIYMGTDRMSWSEDVVEVIAP